VQSLKNHGVVGDPELNYIASYHSRVVVLSHELKVLTVSRDLYY